MGLRAAAAVSGDDGAVTDVVHVPESQRFEVSVDGRRVGLLDYDVQGDAFVALHTEIDPAYGGRGLGGELVEQVLRHVRSAQQRLVPRCSFVAHFVEQHPEYADLVGPTPAGPTAPSTPSGAEGAS